MKNILIGFSIIVFSNISSAENWIKIQENNYYSKPQPKTYGDSKWFELYMMEDVPNFATQTLKNGNPANIAIPYSSRVIKYKLWCNDNRLVDAGTLFFDKPLASGNIVADSIKENHQKVVEMLPETIVEAVFNFTCKGIPIPK